MSGSSHMPSELRCRCALAQTPSHMTMTTEQVASLGGHESNLLRGRAEGALRLPQRPQPTRCGSNWS